jgi:hypothetical protein
MQDRSTTASVIAPIVGGAVLYTGLGVAYLLTANPDRGDLPLVLAIASYAPTTATLIGTAAIKDISSSQMRTISLAAAVTGVAAIPAAVVIANHLDLDPGDTQLVRDAGFWGMAVGLASVAAFGGSVEHYNYGYGNYTSYRSPSGQEVAAGGLIGLYTGLGLGLLGAHFSDVSLERVRVTTWGGYGGVLIGTLIGVAIKDKDGVPFQAGLFGGLTGLVLTFLLTSPLDEIPGDAKMVADNGRPWSTRIAPITVADSRGHANPGLGLTLLLP